MNYYIKIKEAVNKFCAIQPHQTRIADYLADAEQVNNLYLKSVELAEKGDESSEELQQIYNNICKIIEK